MLAAQPEVSAAGANRLLDRLAAAGAARIELAPLDPPDVKALAAGVTGGTPDSGLTSFLDGAGGNPLLALVLLQALVADDAIRVEDGVASLIAPLVPDRFRATVRGRLGSLSLAALHFLQARVLGLTIFTCSILPTICLLLIRSPEVIPRNIPTIILTSWSTMAGW